MAGQARGRGGTPPRRGRPSGARSSAGRRSGAETGAPSAGRRPRASKAIGAAAPPPAPAGPFRLGAIPGATPGKWIDVWRDRMPQTPLELVPLDVSTQRTAITTGDVDAALVRLPIDRDGLSAIALYDETPVVVCAADSHLTAVDELTIADLAGEVVIRPADDVLSVEVPHAVAPRFAPPETTGDAVATAATGVGVVIVPMSLARLHHRKDTAYRPLVDGPVSAVALAWATERTSPLVEAFIGIVRGRTANSSRD